MTKTVIIMDTICITFNKIREKLIFEQNYDIMQFITDYQNAVNQSLHLIKIQNKKYVKEDLTEVLNRQMYGLLHEVVLCKADKEEFWLKV